MSTTRRKLVILISGRGSNMQTIHKATINGQINANIEAVISNNQEAAGLDYANQNEIKTAVLDHRKFDTREAFDEQLMDQIDTFEPDFLILAGFMRILSENFVMHYHGRLLNIHPSLLPKYTGLHTHKRALAAGETEHGASVHFVTAELDAGPVIMQSKVRVQANDTENSLMQAVLKTEHQLYPAAIALLCDGLVEQDNDGVIYEGQPLESPLLLT